METGTACPKCGATRAPDAVECPTCGVIYSKYRGPRMQASPTPEPVTTAVPGPPAHEEPVDEFTEGVWRRGKTLIVSRLAELPDRCVTCNGPAERWIESKLWWHRGWVYVFLLVNILVYALVAMAVRKTAVLRVPQCAQHAKLRRWGVLGAWGIFGLGCLGTYASAHMSDDGPISAAPLVIFFASVLVALVGGTIISRPVVARRIDDEFVWIGKCSKGFLSSLPEAPETI